jgi:hypothetical protein
MARAIRASASSTLIVHSEKGFDPGKLDEGRMAHPPFGMPSPFASPIVVGSKLFLQMSNCPTQPDNKATLVAMAEWWVISNKAGP